MRVWDHGNRGNAGGWEFQGVREFWELLHQSSPPPSYQHETSLVHVDLAPCCGRGIAGRAESGHHRRVKREDAEMPSNLAA